MTQILEIGWCGDHAIDDGIEYADLHCEGVEQDCAGGIRLEGNVVGEPPVTKDFAFYCCMERDNELEWWREDKISLATAYQLLVTKISQHMRIVHGVDIVKHTWRDCGSETSEVDAEVISYFYAQAFPVLAHSTNPHSAALTDE